MRMNYQEGYIVISLNLKGIKVSFNVKNEEEGFEKTKILLS
ncbi:MAG: hypothetical protein ACRDCE_16710 [Cetobacterium sp.]